MINDIVIQNLVKDYGQVRALDHVNLKVPTGSSFGLIGPNGAGKTTLFSLLANFLKPTSGSIEILGHKTSDYNKLYGKIGALPQDALLYRNQTIYAQLLYFSKMLGKNKREAKQEVEYLLECVDLTEKKHVKVSTLSHGMTKRLGIAQALLGSPQIILLDEPLAGLDPPLAKNIRDLIMSFKKDKTLIISSHNLHEIEEICDHVAILSRGKVMASDQLSHIVGQNKIVSYVVERKPDLHPLQSRDEIMDMIYHDHKNCLDIYYDEGLISLSDLNHRIIDFLRDQDIGLLSISSGQSLEESFLKHIQS